VLSLTSEVDLLSSHAARTDFMAHFSGGNNFERVTR
jgi:hypothetical protein